MPTARDRRWPWFVAGYAALFTLVAALAAFIYDSAAPSDRALVVRLAVALVVAVGLIHLRNYFRGDPRWERPSAFEEALAPEPLAPTLDPGFLKLREELANGVASRSFFDKILWPRLVALAETLGRVPEPLPTARRWWRRGPRLREIAAIIERVAGPRG